MKNSLSILFFFFVLLTQAQTKWSIRYERADTFSLPKMELPSLVLDSPDVTLTARIIVQKLRAVGYMGVSVDSTFFDRDTLVVKLYVGQKLENIALRNGNIPDAELTKMNILKSALSHPLPIDKIPLLQKSIIQFYENRGYPFAATYIDSFDNINGEISAAIYVEKHQLITWDSLLVETPSKIRQSFLKNYLGIRPGKPYKEKLFQSMDGRLRLLPFLEPVKSSEVSFLIDKAQPQIFVKDRKANQFDLLIGLLPGSSGQKLLITADATLHLVSIFGVGEEFRLKWQKLQPKTQTLDVQIIYPYFLGFPVGINAQFDLHKVDTSFLNIGGDYGIQFQLPWPATLKTSYRQRSTLVLNADTNFVKMNKQLPSTLDVSSNQFGVELYAQHLNYRFNPTAGFILKVNGSFGLKTIKKNNSIATLVDTKDNTTFSKLYDTIKLKSFIMELGIVYDKFWKINKRNTVRTYFEGKYLLNNRVTTNELYRIGGLNSLRGFDDRSILTPYYAMANAEYRFLLSRNAFVFAFFNAALVKENRHFKERPFDFPFGFGVGTTIETKVGMFALSYAMGRQQDEKVSFRNAKIHFGYINYF